MSSQMGTSYHWLAGQTLDKKSNLCPKSVKALSNVCPVSRKVQGVSRRVMGPELSNWTDPVLFVQLDTHLTVL